MKALTMYQTSTVTDVHALMLWNVTLGTNYVDTIIGSYFSVFLSALSICWLWRLSLLIAWVSIRYKTNRL